MTAISSKTRPKIDLGDILMRKVIIDVKVVEKNGKQTLKLFSEKFLAGKVLNIIVKFIGIFVDLTTLGLVLERMNTSLKKSNESYFKQAIDAFKITVKTKGLDFSHVKKSGPAIFYANHPLCGADVFVVMSEIEKVRPDVKVVVATFLENFPGLKDKCFVVNNLVGDTNAKSYNQEVIQKINKHIADGGALLVFPAGALSTWVDNDRSYAKDIEWRKGFIKFGEAHPETDYYPIFVEGEPSQTHLKLRAFNKHIANAYVFKDLTNQVGTTATIHLASPIKLATISDQSYKYQISYLRNSLYDVGSNYIKDLIKSRSKIKLTDTAMIEQGPFELTQ